MFDITLILEAVILLGGFIIYKKVKDMNNLSKVYDIVNTVVEAANELDITGELIELGKDKAEYAYEQAKALLAKNKITFDENELSVFIKSAVTRLRIELSGTDAEKVEK